MSGTAAATALLGQEQEYECCECFGTFGEDISLGNNAEWAQCACERWIHIDCISETATDENGRKEYVLIALFNPHVLHFTIENSD